MNSPTLWREQFKEFLPILTMRQSNECKDVNLCVHRLSCLN